MNYNYNTIIGYVKSTLKMTTFEARNVAVDGEPFPFPTTGVSAIDNGTGILNRKMSTPQTAWITVLKIRVIMILKQRKRIPAIPIVHACK